MARIRTIKPEFFDHEGLCALSFAHRICYIGLWTQADKAGRMEDRPQRLKARIFPFDDLAMPALLDDLERGGFIVRYSVNGCRYLAIKESAWKEHQRPRSDEPDSTIPQPLDDQTRGAFELRDTSTVTTSSLSSDEVTLGKEKGKGEGERKGKGEVCSTAPAPSEPSSPAVLVFPTSGTNGSAWTLTEAQIGEWQEAFPGLDVLAEAKKALIWVKAHPNRAKTVRGMRPFLVNWLSRSTNSGRGVQRQESPPARVNGAEWVCPHTPKCHAKHWCVTGARDERDKQKAVFNK